MLETSCREDADGPMKHLILKPYRKQPVTIRMNVEQLARIDQLIAQYGLNRSEFINRCIDFGLASMPEAGWASKQEGP